MTQIETFQPDIVWLDNNFLWPLASLAQQNHLPVIIRSQNFEPDHVLDESGHSLPNYFRYGAKYLGEIVALRASTVLVAITPIEQAKYARLSRRPNVELLPLRGLPKHLHSARPAVSRHPLNIFFWGSTYNVSHNQAALAFVTQQLMPQLRTAAPGGFCLHIFGGKVPAAIQTLAAEDLIIHGFVPDLEAALDTMDIAVVPSLYGCGMQQKVFEPLCRGFPTLTSPRGLAGYPFVEGEDVLTAETLNEFIAHLLALQSPHYRSQLARNASQRAAELFSAESQRGAHDRILQRALTPPPL